MTAALVSKGSKLDTDTRNVILAVAFLLEDDIIDQTSEVLADTVATKVFSCIKNVVNCLLLSSEFVSATSTFQAKTTLALKGISSQLKTVVSLLSNVVGKLSAIPTPSPAAQASSLKPT
ncbi:hypothetical protein C0995_003350 [Termitomyces sp. Mi166|nr:hypothetical protein C0995_003350 [Termitomyces sp. Mi166\